MVSRRLSSVCSLRPRDLGERRPEGAEGGSGGFGLGGEVVEEKVSTKLGEPGGVMAGISPPAWVVTGGEVWGGGWEGGVWE